MSKVSEISDATFESEVENSDLPVLLDFSAEWCGPCKQLVPVLEAVAAEYDGKLRVLRLDIDNNRNSAARYGVMSVPTLILVEKGQVKDQIVGYIAKPKLVDRLNKHL